MSEEIIRFSHFGFQYNAQAEPTLYDINLSIRRGEKVLIAGPSGCGKSTLAHCINGLIPFSYRGECTGSLQVCGLETREQSIFALSRHVGTVLQDQDGQFIGLTVAEDIAFAMENDCVPVDELHRRVKEIAGTVEVADFLRHAPNELSGGQKQRVSLGGVLVDDVDILLFDEPLANLDPATGKQAVTLIEQVRQKTNATVLLIEHRLEDVLWGGVDRVILMSEGRIIADLTPDELVCRDLLQRSGIREPLYVTALKYAGVPVTPEMHAGRIGTLTLDAPAMSGVQAWYAARRPVPPEQYPPLLEAGHVRFAYPNGREALHDITVTVGRGEMLAIVGTNGAGKSTFSKVICGFEQQQAGTLRFAGQDLAGLSIKERADRIGYVMQNPNQMISQTMIFEEVALGLRTRGTPEAEIRPRVEKALRVCGLYPFRNWPVSALSFGQKKRVTIASILVLEPEMILLDEPTAGQDFRHYTEIMEFLRGLNRKGLTVVMITHDMHLMLEYAPRAVVFFDGRILTDAPSAHVLTDPGICAQASLKETSLMDLAQLCGIRPADAFVRRFIECDREVRNHAQSV